MRGMKRLVAGKGKYVDVVVTMRFKFNEEMKSLPEAMDISGIFKAVEPTRIAAIFGGDYVGGEAKVSLKGDPV